MELTGLIFAAIAIAWLAYLVPLYLRSRDNEQLRSDTEVDRFADSMRVIARGAAPLVDHDGAPLDMVEVSTPLTRRAAVRDLHRLEAQAASRRRRVLVALMALTTAVVVVCALGLLPWWSVAAPGLLVVGFVVVARISVKAMKRSLQARFEAITDSSDEATVFLRRTDVVDANEPSVGLALNVPVATSHALWDPLPITMPTYVSSRPLAPRTVRTIDLSAPEVRVAGDAAEVPVTADGPVVEVVETPDTEVVPVASGHDDNAYDEGERRRVVGE
ncbi:divisome protein SepX/GlpR [Microlunatus sp. Y2014]|uniref:divisome protein SepX/GlpR n=1 Tax=Microlunatus sp. Y2014 TaxID=3418488 RepID=UPI003DA6EC83